MKKMTLDGDDDGDDDDDDAVKCNWTKSMTAECAPPKRNLFIESLTE